MRPNLWMILLLISSSCFAQQVQDDPAVAFSQASRENKNLLLLFTGSDWCIPCIQFEKKILQDTAFQQFATTRLIILRIDFPQKRKVAPPLRAAYESLADQYDPTGVFPQIILLSPDKRILGSWTYDHETTDDFIRKLNPLISFR